MWYHYIHRPFSLEELSHYEFVSFIQITKNEDVSHDYFLPSHDNNSTHFLKVRDNPIIPLLYCNYPQTQTKESLPEQIQLYQGTCMILFKPFRNLISLQNSNFIPLK